MSNLWGLARSLAIMRRPSRMYGSVAQWLDSIMLKDVAGEPALCIR